MVARKVALYDGENATGMKRIDKITAADEEGAATA
jgi:hypothetical protein